MARKGHTVRGIVVDHKESGVRYAVSERNYNPKIHTKVRELDPGETVLGFRPKRKEQTRKAAPNPAVDDGTKAPSPEGTEDTTNRKD